MATFKYFEKGGRVIRRLLTEKPRLRGLERPDGHFSETILKGYYARECEEGSRFRSSYTKTQIKNAHERAIQRFEQLKQES